MKILRLVTLLLLLPLLGAVAAPSTAPDPIPQTMLDALRCGGVNLQFGWYDSDNPDLTMFDNELPLVRAAGACHVRLPISMGTIEAGTTGHVRVARYTALTAFVTRAHAQGLLVIIDVHNTGLKEPGSSDWTDNYMFGIADPAIRARHRSLLVDLAGRLSRDLDPSWFILQPANEPIYTTEGSRTADPDIWYDYQNELIPALRGACLNCVLFVMANDWQGHEATLYNLPIDRLVDARTIVDVHFYEPMNLSHCGGYSGRPNNCGGLQFPGTYTTWRGTQLWNRALIDELLNPLSTWQTRHNVPFIHFSEVGTTAALADGVRAAYLGAVISVLRSHGFGYTVYEWHKSFGIKASPLTLAVVFDTAPVVTPSPTPSAMPTYTPTPSVTFSVTPTLRATPELDFVICMSEGAQVVNDIVSFNAVDCIIRRR